MESDGTSLHFALLQALKMKDISSVWQKYSQMSTDLNINLVSAENNGDVFANTLEVTMPVGDVLVGDTGSNIEHDDTALALDVVSIAETTELLLSSGVPDVEADGTEVGGEGERVDLDTEGG